MDKEIMMKAIWNGAILAESDSIITLEHNHYFPEEALNRQYFKPSGTTTLCPWKGTANYYTIEVEGELNKDAAWEYREPKAEAKHIKGYIAFWRGVEIREC